ncbi:transglutaminase domain-containing protein [Candidatus Bathyarchaeota archaeon]|nr:transglutaminase domain-containing protein [Candidatus Bathyarchaeota archaeon]
MRKNRGILTFILISVLLVPLVSAADTTNYFYRLDYTFENMGDEDFPLEQEDYTLPLFLNNTWQSVTILNRSGDFTRAVIDLDGNLGIIMDVDDILAPGESLSFGIEYLIESKPQERPSFSMAEAEGFNEIPPDLVSEYTGHTESFTVDDQTISDVAKRAAKGDETVLGTVANLLDYVTQNTTYCNFETPRYPLDTLSDSLGDCDDQSILLISMARSLGIPAYLKVGVIIHPNIVDSDTSWEGHLENDADGIGWHGWVMIYIPPWGWVPVDLTLIDEDTGLDYIINSPEYDPNIIEALNVSEQAYIGDTLITRERIIASDLHVTIIDEAGEVYRNGLGAETYLILVIGSALAVAIFMMFRASARDQ